MVPAIYQEIVQVLLDNGANKELRDNYGKTAEDYARELGLFTTIDPIDHYFLKKKKSFR